MSAAGAKPAPQAGVPQTDVAGIVGLIDRLEKLLNASELTEMEIEVGETALVLRKPGAFARRPKRERAVTRWPHRLRRSRLSHRRRRQPRNPR